MPRPSFSSARIALTKVPAPSAGIADELAAPAGAPWLPIPFHLIEPAVFASDLLVIVGTSVLAGIAYSSISVGDVGSIETFLGIGLLVFAHFSAFLAAQGSYRIKNLVHFRRQVRQVTVTWLSVTFILLVVAFSLKIAHEFSRGATITFFVFGWFNVLTWRSFLAKLLADALATGAFAERKIILIGEQSQLTSSTALLEFRRCGYRPVETFLVTDQEIRSSGMPPSLRSKLAAAIETARQDSVEDIFLLIGWHRSRCIEDILTMLRVLPVPVRLIPDQSVSHYLNCPMVHVGSAWTAELKRAPLTIFERVLKRSVDVVAASIGLVFLSPLLLLTALLIKFGSKGPVLFTQDRNGFNGKSFRIFKFRTMRVLEDGPVIRQATRDDPRVTAFGRLLRRTSIDELPQLFNVLRGEMSLVGPRPHAAAHNTEYEQVIATYAFRHHVKPGISGWAQVNGYRGETRTIERMAKRVELDLWYINNWSFWLDLKILLWSLVVGFRHPSAY